MSATDPGPAIRRLQLQNFRSYAKLDLEVPGRLVALTGENGAGKTNLLEAVSLFVQGRGLRRAELSEMARVDGDGGFAVSAVVETATGDGRRGTGLERVADGSFQRRYRIDRSPVGSAAAFAAHLRIVWLTPALDGLFTGAAGDRRRFLDRLVLAVDAGHAARAHARCHGACTDGRGAEGRREAEGVARRAAAEDAEGLHGGDERARWEEARELLRRGRRREDRRRPRRRERP